MKSKTERVEALKASLCKNTERNSKVLCTSCYGNELCRLEKLTDEQLDYIFYSKNTNALLRACPGSGKTEVVGIKAAYEMNHWNESPSGIAILSFTNNSSNVISERVSQFTDLRKCKFPHFIGTIDGWLHGYLAQPYSYLRTGYLGNKGDRSLKIIESESSPQKSGAAFLHAYKLKTSYPFLSNDQTLRSTPLYANNIRFEEGWEICVPNSKRAEYIKLSAFCNSEQFAKYKQSIAKPGKPSDWLDAGYISKGFVESKRKFLSDGFATYHDVEGICLGLLRQHELIAERMSKRFSFVIVDECQDLSNLQIKILEELGKRGTKLHFIGDLNQAIYSFKNVSPVANEEYTKQSEFNELSLSTNFRSSRPIVDFCTKLVDNVDGVFANLESNLKEPLIVLSYEKSSVWKISKWFEDVLSSLSIDLAHSRILARGRGTISRITGRTAQQSSSKQVLLAKALFLYKNKKLKESIQVFGRFLSKVYFEKHPTHASRFYSPYDKISPLHWRLVLADCLEVIAKDQELGDLNTNWKKWSAATRTKLPQLLRDSLGRLLAYHTDLSGAIGETLQFNAPSGKGESKVLDSVKTDSNLNSKIQTTTIHDVKGETFEAVMLVSSPTKSGTIDGHWEQWLQNRESEAARLAYVASSRPVKLLVWAVPDITETDRMQFEELGFSYHTI